MSTKPKVTVGKDEKSILKANADKALYSFGGDKKLIPLRYLLKSSRFIILPIALLILAHLGWILLLMWTPGIFPSLGWWVWLIYLGPLIFEALAYGIGLLMRSRPVDNNIF
jgi:hypothetical protein